MRRVGPAVRRSLRPRALLLLASVPWLSAGCAGSLFKTQFPPPALYVLSPAARTEDTPLGASGPGNVTEGLALLKPRVRAGLDNDRIAAQYPDRRLEYFADARWSSPLDESIQDLALQLFHSRAGLPDVTSDASAFASTFWLEMDVLDFQAMYGADGAPPDVHVHLLARIGGSGQKGVLARFEADVREAATANRLSAIVAAFDHAANQALMQIGTGCETALAAQSREPQ